MENGTSNSTRISCVIVNWHSFLIVRLWSSVLPKVLLDFRPKFRMFLKTLHLLLQPALGAQQQTFCWLGQWATVM